MAARIILIRGPGGATMERFDLAPTKTRLGRANCEINLPGDPSMSEHHCSLMFENDQVILRDERSQNGVFLRSAKTMPLKSGQLFSCGEQYLRFEAFRPPPMAVGMDGAVFLGTPVIPWKYRLVQVLEGGMDGLAHCCRKASLTMGRGDNDLNFPNDPFISHQHAEIFEKGGQFYLRDLKSSNGTFWRIGGQVRLRDHDQFFVGKHLFMLDLAS